MSGAGDGKLGTKDNVPVLMKPPVQQRVQTLPREHTGERKIRVVMKPTEGTGRGSWDAMKQEIRCGMA